MSIYLGQEISDQIQERWEKGFSVVEVSSLHQSAAAFSISALLLNKKKFRVALICPASDDAESFVRDIRSFLKFNSAEESLLDAVDYLPGWEHSPYQDFSPSIKARIKRIKTYFKLLDGSLRCLVTDPESFSRYCPQPSSLKARSFSLSVSDVITREELVSKLSQAGYTRADPVEDVGSYSIRGGLIDIFSPSSKKPYRIEFFDDLLESIRLFDPRTQASEPNRDIQHMQVLPVTEWPFDTPSLDKAKSKIKHFCDEKGIAKPVRDDLFEKLDLGIKDLNLDYLAPFFSDQYNATLADYFLPAGGAEKWRVSIYDGLSTIPNHDNLIASLKEGFARTVNSGKICSPWQDLYLSTELFQKNAVQPCSLQFEKVSLGIDPTHHKEDGPPELSHKFLVTCLENKDLIKKDSSKAILQDFLEKISLWREHAFSIFIVSSSSVQSERINFFLSQKEIPNKTVSQIDPDFKSGVQILEGSLSHGFRFPEYKLAFVTDSEIFGPKKPKSQKSDGADPMAKLNLETFIPSLEQLEQDEFVVHQTHGVGRYKGLVKLQVDQVWADFLLLEYAGSDKLYLPVYRLDQVQKYIGAETNIVLDKLGSLSFEKTKQKIKAELHDVAAKLLELYAKRATREGFQYSPPDEIYREFEAKFPYAETQDQMKSIEAVLEDMQSQKIMDRLVCGDVGYGKTEVAIRAAVKAVLDGKQVAVLVPTTVLALQHERSFTERLKDLSVPIQIGSLSRFKSSKEVKETLQKLKEGQVDIVIGTHRLLSKDVVFKDLGLMIIDEEQRFGVEHKEKLKSFKLNTDVLTLTATPIPRTLNFALMGLRDISVINTPPVDRLSVRTYVSQFNESIIQNAINQELARGGQVFFIHNRVQSIHAMEERLRKIVPDAKIIVAHGQLSEKDLEERMLDFYNKKGNVLLCSTIIESGLDIPSANTIIINRADTFGLAQLYQLRGRVGRSQIRAYCYLLLPEEGAVTEDAKKRLEVITRFVDLGSGFKISSHDLELRGGGDFLGSSQSGHIAQVGFEMFTDLLDETIRELKGQPQVDLFDPEIKLPVSAILSENYVSDVHQRLGFYKRLSQTETAESLHEIETLLEDRYGKLPQEAKNLIWLIRIKQTLRKHHIKALVAGKERTSLDASGSPRIVPDKVMGLIKKQPNVFSVTPESKIILKKPFVSAEVLFQEIQKFFSQVADPNVAC